jgi:hypothetical protein
MARWLALYLLWDVTNSNIDRVGRFATEERQLSLV